MKKGFTLVEIIISITLVLIIGVSGTFFVVNKNKKADLESVTNTILEAANLFAKSERDKDGIIYRNKVLTGGKGVKIPLSTLLSEGYIDENMANIVYNNATLGNPDEGKDYYVMVLTDSNYCDEGATVTITSWMDLEDGEKTLYLCDYNVENEVCEDSVCESEQQLNLIDNILKNAHVPLKTSISTDDFDEIESLVALVGTTESAGTVYLSKKNGLYRKNDIDFYYRGVVTNNYVDILGDSFRIISFNKDNYTMKLITEYSISSDYYLSASKPTSTDFVNSKLYEALYNWKNGYMPGWADIFVNGNFCIGNTSCETLTQLEVGLISKSEAEFAGVPTSVPGGVCYKLYRGSGCSSLTYVSNGWLTSGGSTFTSNVVEKSYRNEVWYEHILIANDIYKNYGGVVGLFANMDTEIYFNTNLYKNYKDNIAKSIRPVIVIDTKKITSYTGNGSKESPYKIDFEW